LNVLDIITVNSVEKLSNCLVLALFYEITIELLYAKSTILILISFYSSFIYSTYHNHAQDKKISQLVIQALYFHIKPSCDLPRIHPIFKGERHDGKIVKACIKCTHQQRREGKSCGKVIKRGSFYRIKDLGEDEKVF
jgi:hypothetical protein